MRRFTSRSLIFDATVTLRVAAKDGRRTAIICTISYATQRKPLVSQIGKWDVILRKKTLILCVDQLWCRQNYSESWVIRELTTHGSQAIRGCRGMAGSIDGPGHLWMLRNGGRAIRGSMDGLDPPLAPNSDLSHGLIRKVRTWLGEVPGA